jgi:deoxyxylulose-5-phosphate synthase
VSGMATKSLSRIRQEKTRRLLILVNDQEEVVKENVKQEATSLV